MKVDLINKNLNNLEIALKDGLKEQRKERIANAMKMSDCGSCHLNQGLELPKSNLTLDSFKGFVRGTGRWTIESNMPSYSVEQISEKELEILFNAIYK
ncbi:hypothetical protein CCZ01_05365 [Helicobacter monodelphidis]|uniref:hypothetical protein n=1 Tax=Helicobacter sp. 15-1451 TaxID=2004995 RepID=UPI000DCEF187|nr:hypothetical protein [Helicobacter sp. 15-1451]RAX57715.1 hypothetical protein CCZ01_05365 [Helicobacter sp. 15-1451]